MSSTTRAVRRASVEAAIDAAAGAPVVLRAHQIASRSRRGRPTTTPSTQKWWASDGDRPSDEIVERFHGTVASCGRNTEATAPTAGCYLRLHDRITSYDVIGSWSSSVWLLLCASAVSYFHRLWLLTYIYWTINYAGTNTLRQHTCKNSFNTMAIKFTSLWITLSNCR